VKKRSWFVFIAVALFVYASVYATHAYERHQAYKTGVYVGKVSFKAADFQNRH